MTTPATVRRATPKVKPTPTPGAARLLAAVEADPGRTAADYARSLGVSRTVAHRHVNRLIEDGHLVCRGRTLRPSGAEPEPVARRATLGQQLSHLRERRGLTIAEAAARGGVHYNTLYLAERDQSSPSFENVRRWLVAWGVPRAEAARVLLSDLA
jgi:DNA-binding XRE family transcriptional regulator